MKHGRLAVPVAALGMCGALLVACSSGPKDGGSKSSSGSPRSSSSAVSSSTPAGGSDSSTPGSSSSSGPPPIVVPPCEAVLPLVTLEDALQTKVVGKTAFIVNLPDPKIGMQARINCRYGLGEPAKKGDEPVPGVEVSVSGYDTADHAQERVAATITAWRNNGATPTDVTIDADHGTLLTGYGSPLLVVQHDRLTVAITVSAALLKGHSPTAVMAQVAAQAIRGAS